MSEKNKPPAAPANNFIRNIIDADLASGKYAARTWGGKPGAAQTHANAPQDPEVTKGARHALIRMPTKDESTRPVDC